MKIKIVGLASLLSAIILLGAGCNNSQVNGNPVQPGEQKTPIVGGDRDAHGCIGSAGYSWCEAKQKCLRPWEESCGSATSSLTYLVSKEDTTKFCNGVDMDSAGYRKTIVTSITTDTPAMTQSELIKKTLDLATTGMCRTVLGQLDVSVSSSIAYIPPIDGWAGVSITMCSCKPQVEVNLLRIPGIKEVIWQ